MSPAERKTLPADLDFVGDVGNFFRRRADRKNQEEFSQDAPNQRNSRLLAPRAVGKKPADPLLICPHPGRRGGWAIQPKAKRKKLIRKRSRPTSTATKWPSRRCSPKMRPSEELSKGSVHPISQFHQAGSSAGRNSKTATSRSKPSSTRRAQMLASSDDFSGIYFFINSALIILREGLEAALVLAAIIAMLKVMGATHAVRYIHMGWILALVAGVLTWLATQTVLTFSGQHRESMEGFISIFAAVALFYVGYWLHTKPRPRDGRASFKTKCKTCFRRQEDLSDSWESHFSPSIARPSRSCSFTRRCGCRMKITITPILWRLRRRRSRGARRPHLRHFQARPAKFR